MIKKHKPKVLFLINLTVFLFLRNVISKNHRNSLTTDDHGAKENWHIYGWWLYAYHHLLSCQYSSVVKWFQLLIIWLFSAQEKHQFTTWHGSSSNWKKGHNITICKFPKINRRGDSFTYVGDKIPSLLSVLSSPFCFFFVSIRNLSNFEMKCDKNKQLE